MKLSAVVRIFVLHQDNVNK